MPASEQTWRNQKKMHVIFAVSVLIMGVATIWMMAADHMREWKDWQLKDRRKDAWMLASRRDSLAEVYSREMADYAAEIRRLDSQAIDKGVIDAFKQRVSEAEAAARRAASGETADDGPAEPAPIDERRFAKLNERVQALNAAAEEVEKIRGEGAGEDGVEEAPKALSLAEDRAIAARQAVLEEMDRYVREARRRELALVTEKKAVNGTRTAKVSQLGIMIGNGAPERELKDIQSGDGGIDELDANLASLTEQIADAKDYRLDLEGFVAEASAEKAALAKELDTMETELSLLDDQVYKNTSNVGEWVTRWPVLNALYSGNIRVEQNWLPDLTINYNFAQVARFDRCTTCHRAISTTAPGTATDPLYPTLPEEEQDLSLVMATPEEAPESTPANDEERVTLVLDKFGLALSETGIIDDAEVTVHYVLPESPAAKAGLQSGDKLTSIGGYVPSTPAEARSYLLANTTWGEPLTIDVHRGLEHPFTAHPRLDLYLTDTSPHPQKDVGCTICHDGQGSGTSFQWTSHTPDNAVEQDRWANVLGWSDNHHWIFPMKPARFVESNCLKCHHEKGGLEPSERFPEPPAPKLVEGWSLVQDFGCFGCHEINGYDSPEMTVGPDVRVEPAYHEAAAQILRDENLNDDEQSYAERVVAQPADDEARELLYASILHDEAAATDQDEDTEARLSPETHKVAAVLKPIETPGRMRKVGPSLRYVASKVDYDWLYAWIRQPSNFRPTTRMPQFFGQYEHLDEEDDALQLQESLRFEPIEIRALADYLLTQSDEFEYLPREEGVEAASAERGKWLFESRGCLACHEHKEFPDTEYAADQGPDLSEIAAKLNSERGRDWLYSWIRQPNRYHARTVMPDLFLDPINELDAQSRPTGVVTDPAADIEAFLLGVESEWEPEDVPARDEWSDAELQALEDLAVLWLKSDAVPASPARQYLREGIPEEQAPKLKADERMLVGITSANRTERQLEFVARRTIGKYGCFGCHDIPGFEDAKPIGTALVDWGRKETSKLAFENIHRFLETHGINPEQPSEEELQRARDAEPPTEEEAAAAPAAGGHPGALHAEHLDPGDFGDKPEGYFIQSLNAHGRDGFLWQKLRFPRSYDYKTTRNKNFNERLRMPRFPFNDEQREAVMTFVLGLVKEPPASKYLYRPDPRQQAINEGRAVLEQFNCMGCHTLKMEQWELTYDAATFQPPDEVVEYPFLAPQFTDEQIARSLTPDYRGFLHATVHGEPAYDVETGEQPLVDPDLTPITLEELREAEAEEGETIPVYYQFTLWRDVLLNGMPYIRGGTALTIPADRETRGPAGGKAYPAWGGDLTRYLFPKVIEHARESGSQAPPTEAWGWLPPPLMDEGVKVQTDWLHGFLMDPFAIRPAVVMRMPNFHMSSAEAAALVNYFAAASGAEFPYEYRERQRASYLASVSQERENPLGEAMQIVVNGTYCVKCHAVAEFTPQGDPYTFGPNLAEVYRRMRPTFLRDWIANPARILPYTGMPKNIPYNSDDPAQDGVSEALFRGNSIEQVDGVVDLLMNFDMYARGHTSITPLVEESAAAAAAAGTPATGEAAPAEAAPAEATEESAAEAVEDEQDNAEDAPAEPDAPADDSTQ